MKRSVLTLMLAWFGISGCAGRMNTDLLQARIREQATQLTETQREIAKARSELKESRLEAERLKTELAQTNHAGEVTLPSSAHIHKLRINSLASGGLNKDGFPGDDTVVVQFVPLDRDNETVKQAGDLEFTIIDPQLPESDRELGRWSFTSAQCREHWTRGITSSGFQFSLPLEQPPQHTDLVVQLQYKTPDARRYNVSHIVKVAVSTGNSTAMNTRTRRKPVKVVDELDDTLPPVGDQDSNAAEDEASDWDREKSGSEPTKPGHTVLHSANWTDATIPRLR